MKKPVVLTIVDGLGLREETQGNAFKQANTPFLDKLQAEYPISTLKAAGKEVGLPAGQIGNSEVGHLNIGAGQIVYTGLELVRKALDDDSFKDNEAFMESINFAKKNNGAIQVAGLLSPGGVHSLEEHLFALLDALHAHGVKNVTVHAFTDGRDVAPRSVKASLEKLMPVLEKYSYKLGSIGGRLYGMDRDQNFDKTELAYEALQGRAAKTFDDVFAYIEDQYNNANNNDEFIDIAVNSDASTNFYKENDSFIFFNFRPDRAQQLAHLIIGSDKYKYAPKNQIKNTQLTTMMKYEGIDKALVAFDSQKVKDTLGSALSNAGLKQLRIAETQKYAHVTFFMDGGVDVQMKGADRELIDSVKVDDFSEAPEMSAKGITDKLLQVIDKYDAVIMNYANPDMVGHTGDTAATIKAVEFIDQELKRLFDKVEELDGTMFITADHGNCEIVEDENGNPSTKHTTSDVFLISTDKSVKLNDGSLANVAPTILDYLNVEIPSTMTHKSLIAK